MIPVETLNLELFKETFLLFNIIYFSEGPNLFSKALIPKTKGIVTAVITRPSAAIW